MESLDYEGEETERTRAVLDVILTENRWCYTGPELFAEGSVGRVWGASAGDAAKMWGRYEAHWPTETDRMRFCRGCRFLQTAGPSLVCGYLLCTGRRRPCPFGGPCAAKKLIPGYPLPADYEKRLLAEASEGKTGTKVSDRNPPGKRGPKSTWDEAYAIDLVGRGFRLKEISRIMGASYGAMLRVGNEHGWFRPGPRGPQNERNLEEEKARFREYLEKKQNSGK